MSKAHHTRLAWHTLLLLSGSECTSHHLNSLKQHQEHTLKVHVSIQERKEGQKESHSNEAAAC